MTEFRSFPTIRFDLPESGKVTGTYTLTFRGEGSALARTDGAHINDNNPAVDFRGESFLLHLELRRDPATGEVTFGESSGSRSPRGGVTRRSNWSDAPPSYADKIGEAIRAHAQSVWTDEHDRAGLEADAMQNLHRLERDLDEAQTQVRALREQASHHLARLAAAQEVKA